MLLRERIAFALLMLFLGGSMIPFILLFLLEPIYFGDALPAILARIGEVALILAACLSLVMILLRVCAPQIAVGLLKKQVCPVCNYSLAGLESPGIVICPECGGAWTPPCHDLSVIHRFGTFPDAGGRRVQTLRLTLALRRNMLRQDRRWFVRLIWLGHGLPAIGFVLSLVYVLYCMITASSGVYVDRIMLQGHWPFVVLVCIGIAYLSGLRWLAPRIVPRLLRDGCCPNCGSEFGAAADAGVIDCAVCGCSWRMVEEGLPKVAEVHTADVEQATGA